MQVEITSATEAIIRGPRTLSEWRESRAFFVPGHDYAPRFRSGDWDGKRWPGKWCRAVGDTIELCGSIGLALRAGKELGFSVPNAADPVDVGRWTALAPRVDELRDYQRTALTNALIRGWGRADLATNAGKGAIIGLIARWARDNDLSVLVLCDERLTFEALKNEHLPDWGGLGPRQLRLVNQGVKTPPVHPAATLAMVPTLSRRIKDETTGKLWRTWVGAHQVVILDEADKATADSWRGILKNAVSSRWRVGFSGTFPNPKEDPHGEMLIDELMGPTLAEASNMELVARGVSVRPTVELYRFDVTSSLQQGIPWPRRWGGGELRSLMFDYAIMHNAARHAFIASLIQDAPTVIILDRIEHGHALQRAIAGSAFMDGSVDEARRNATLSAFDAGDLKVIIATRIFDRGTNRLARAHDLILAGSAGSERQVLQRIGRGLRRAEGKEFLRVVDIMDVVDESLLSQTVSASKAERIARYLEDAVRRRLETYNGEGFEVQIVSR